MLRALIAALLLLLRLSVPAAEPLRVAVIPWLEPEALKKLYGPTVRLLERKLGGPVEMLVARDYEELTQRATSQAAEVLIYGPASYVLAKRKHPRLRYLATCMLPDDHYFSIVFVKKESPLAKLADLKGRSIGLTDKQSTSGYIVPLGMFARAGINPETDGRTFLLRRHHRVFDAIVEGMVDAGAADSGAWNEAVAKHGDIFRVIARSAPLPRDPVVAAPHVGEKFLARIQAILVAAAQDPQFARESAELKGYSVRDDRFYDVVRKMAFEK